MPEQIKQIYVLGPQRVTNLPLGAIPQQEELEVPDMEVVPTPAKREGEMPACPWSG